MLRFIAFPTLLLVAVCVACAGRQPVDPGAVAAAYAEEGRYDEAAREIEIAVRMRPNDVELRKQAAGIYEHTGKIRTAERHLEKALDLTRRKDPYVWIAIGDLETRRDNSADAYIAYKHASELAPDEIRAVSGLAMAAERIGFDEEADAAHARWSALEAQRNADPPKSPLN